MKQIVATGISVFGNSILFYYITVLTFVAEVPHFIFTGSNELSRVLLILFTILICSVLAIGSMAHKQVGYIDISFQYKNILYFHVHTYACMHIDWKYASKIHCISPLGTPLELQGAPKVNCCNARYGNRADCLVVLLLCNYKKIFEFSKTSKFQFVYKINSKKNWKESDFLPKLYNRHSAWLLLTALLYFKCRIGNIKLFGRKPLPDMYPFKVIRFSQLIVIFILGLLIDYWI